MDILVLAQPRSLMQLYVWSQTGKHVLTELPGVIFVDALQSTGKVKYTVMSAEILILIQLVDGEFTYLKFNQ